MAGGGCFCGNIRIEYTGQPLASGICHCDDCRKLTGSVFSYSYLVKRTDLKVTGNPKAVDKKSDSGNSIKNYFCPDCGTPVYGQRTEASGELADVTILRAGVFDDPNIMNQRRPVAELYTKNRVNWIGPVEDAEQFHGMMPLP